MTETTQRRLLGLALGTALACAPPEAPRADPASEGVEVRFRTSKPHGLVNFVETIAGYPHRSPILREAFEDSPLRGPESAAAIERFRATAESLHLGVNFDGYPVERHMGRTLDKMLLAQSVFATDLDDLGERAAAMLPVAAHHELFSSLAALEPIYDELIWEPYRDELEDYRARLDEHAREWEIERLFARAARFYGADWPEGLPFVVALYPIPEGSGHTSAESIANVESVGVVFDEQDLGERFGVVFHEMCHSLWEAEPPSLQHDIERWFMASSSSHARLAYQHVNEALATALGNGWARAQALGEVDDGEWYADPYVDGYSKALFPSVEQYLEHERSLDQEFVAEAVETFERLFPEAVHDLEQLMNQVVLMLDGERLAPHDVVSVLQNHFRMSSVSTSAPIEHPKSLEQVGESGETLVLVVSSEGVRQLDALARVYPPIAGHLDELASLGDGSIAGVDAGGRGWIVFRADSLEALTTVVERLKQRGRI